MPSKPYLWIFAVAKASSSQRTQSTPPAKFPTTQRALGNPRLPSDFVQSLLLLLLPLLVYGRTVGFDFTHHDDDRMIADNAAILARGFDWALIFGTDAWFMPGQIELYRPWQSLTYLLDFQIGGTSAWVYHLHNILVFSLNSLLLHRLLRWMLDHAVLAFYGALLYSVHFLFVHAVCWIPARGDLYLFLFGTAALLSVYGFVRRGHLGWLLANACLTFLALLSKESAVVLPLVTGIVLFVHRSQRPLGITTTLWSVATVGFVGLYFILRSGAVAVGNNLTISAFLANVRTLPEETAKFFVPVGFSVMPVFSVPITVLGILMGTGLLIALYRQRAALPATLVWPSLSLFGLSLAPSLFYAPTFAGMAYDYLDHRAYFGFLGLWILLLGWAKGAKWPEQRWAMPVIAAVVVLSSLASIFFSGAYRDKWTYYGNALSTNPNSGLANLNFGIFLRQEGAHRLPEALPYFEKAVAGSPGYYDSHLRLAECLNLLGRPQEGLPHAEEAIRLLGDKPGPDPFTSDAHSVRGAIWGKMGDHHKALADFESALRYSPEDASNLYNKGLALRNLNRREEAILAFEKAVKKRRDYAEAWYELGFNLGVLNRFGEAKMALDEAIRYQPGNANALLFRGMAQNSLGNRAAACADWQQAAQLGKPEASGFLAKECR
jgi:tetratricopeptide (TPR) repeat protein